MPNTTDAAQLSVGDERPEFLIPVVVFVATRGVDRHDAGTGAELALIQLIEGHSGPPHGNKVPITLTMRDRTHEMTVTGVSEINRAFRNFNLSIEARP